MRRSRLDIIIDVLEAGKEGTNKTSIVYKANLNFKLVKEYLDLLQKHGLIENKLNKYMTTEDGKSFLDKAKEVSLL
jgi:predicted transcriptional regulator